jgi:hypothetical protein
MFCHRPNSIAAQFSDYLITAITVQFRCRKTVPFRSRLEKKNSTLFKLLLSFFPNLVHNILMQLFILEQKKNHER